MYGKYLSRSCLVVAYKQPSFIKKVNYKALTDELYAFPISGDAQADVYIKKLIANVNVGLLEKGMNRRSAGYLFKDQAECNYFQAQHGGMVHRIQKIEDHCVAYDRSPLSIDESVEDMKHIVNCRFEQVGDPYCVLVMKAEKQLRSGFRYTKELVLQGHNQKLMQAYDL